ncbi:M56 family metallopeptidase [Rhodopirellula sallentina]|uniref:Peptidase M56, BlaR1 domain-containing protein n=1 Tax=Rhodopirellula sallentina SM41 TaxID=1263870 RepID=M5UAE8_9BACT|nr:M56 family metallopeptidase [Rhodopirellula sallentina]EMI54811.1 Peptidase M56, BlaR1 domain-containing protein [Rhodopirellula sallentina SM41]
MSLSDWMFDVSIKSFVVMAIVTLIALVFHRSSAAVRHRIWTLGLCGTLSIPLLTWLLPSYQVNILPPRSVAEVETTASTISTAESNEMVDPLFSSEAPPQSLSALPDAITIDTASSTEATHQPDLAPTPQDPIPSVIQTPSSNDSWWIVLYLIGAAVLLATWLLRQIQTLTWISKAHPVDDAHVLSLLSIVCKDWTARNALSRSPNVSLLYRQDLSMPCAAGIFRPVILLPTDCLTWREERLRSVLLHELAHVIRRDLLTQSLAEICRAVYWFNPFVWLAVARLHVEREQACDDHVLRAGVVASAYAETLLDVARDYRRPHRAIGLAMARPNALQQRICSLLDATRSRIAVNHSVAICALAAITMISGTVSALRPSSIAGESTKIAEQIDKHGVQTRGIGPATEVLLRGTVIDQKGNSVHDPLIEISLHIDRDNQLVTPTISGNSFEAWLPASGSNWYSVSVDVRRDDKSDERAFYSVSRRELRGYLEEGMNIQLQRPTGSTEVRVIEENHPVPNANVQVQIASGRTAHEKTDRNGIARIDLYENKTLWSITAWTTDYRVGGYQFSRQPVRDNTAPVHYVELSKCRDQTIRMVDEDRNVIEGIEFRMQLATPVPHVNYIGTTDQWELKTDSNGEAVLKYFPDWPEVHRYAELLSQNWFILKKATPVDDALVITLKRRAERHRVMGTLTGDQTNMAGFNVRAGTFQAETEGHTEQLYAITDPEGHFWIDVLSGATYCVHINDSNLTSDYSDVLAFDPETSQVNAPELTLQKGVVAKAKLTAGKDRTPIANANVSFRENHSYEWMEDGESRVGVTGRNTWATTNKDGVASMVVLPGAVEVSASQNDWRSSDRIDAAEDGENFVEIHREIAEPRLVTGTLVLADNIDASLGDCVLTIGAIDGKTQDERTLQQKGGATFSFTTAATKLGVGAITDDERFAGVTIAHDLSQPIVITMHPTQTLHGRVTNSDGTPAAGRTITAIGNISDPTTSQTVDPFGMVSFPSRVRLVKRSATSDAHGNYAITGLPCFLATHIYAEGQDWRLDEVYLQPGEKRPPLVSKLRSTTQPKTSHRPIAQRWSNLMRDCRLGGYRPMVILSQDNSTMDQFAGDHLTNYLKNPSAAKFMTLTYHPDPAEADFTATQNWAVPSDNKLTAIAYDKVGTEIGRETFDVSDPGCVAQASAFLNQHAPEDVDMEEAWNEAFAVAKKTDRRVWVRLSGRYCGPCFTFARWLDDHSDVLSKDFVMLKLEQGSSSENSEIVNRLTDGKHVGIPYHAMFTADGTRVIDSNGPLGNIGSPSGFEGKQHLKEMLQASCKRISNSEIESIISSR